MTGTFCLPEDTPDPVLSAHDYLTVFYFPNMCQFPQDGTTVLRMLRDHIFLGSRIFIDLLDGLLFSRFASNSLDIQKNEERSEEYSTLLWIVQRFSVFWFWYLKSILDIQYIFWIRRYDVTCFWSQRKPFYFVLLEMLISSSEFPE